MPPARVTFLLHIKLNKSNSAGDNAHGECSRTVDYITPNNGARRSFDQAGHFLRYAARYTYIDVGVISYVSRKYQPRSVIVQRLYLQHVPCNVDPP